MAQDQRVEFLFAAQVSGQEQLQKLISSVDSLRKETEQLKSANAGLASSTNAVISNGVRYNNALDAQSKALRQNRQGTQQLGLQINDFAKEAKAVTPCLKWAALLAVLARFLLGLGARQLLSGQWRFLHYGAL